MTYRRIASLKNYAAFTEYLEEQGVELPCDMELQTGTQSPLGSPLIQESFSIGNRFCILPMEGWDGTRDGKPTELTRRRWRNFGISGAKLIWGGEAVAVRPDGRANPNQLMINDPNLSHLESLREELQAVHRERFDSDSDLLVGLQLTHSGRYAKPNDNSKPEPRPAQRNRVLDRRVGVTDDGQLLTDDELSKLVEHFIKAAVLAEKAGFRFVDVKHCHGYLGHELLSGVDRPGRYGGCFENRTRFLREIVEGVQASAPNMMLGVRLSVFDFVPYRAGIDRLGEPEPEADRRLVFGADDSGVAIRLDEPHRFADLLEELGVRLVCTTAGSPYYNPHIQRPAYFPPSDGYQPPEEPLRGVARQIQAVAQLKSRHPALTFVGSGYSYLQEWLPHVGQAVVRTGQADAVGVGRMVLSYPDLPADVLAGKPMARKRVCRTFSDCTTAPRNGMVSGCYPLDSYYKSRPEWETLKQLKSGN